MRKFKTWLVVLLGSSLSACSTAPLTPEQQVRQLEQAQAPAVPPAQCQQPAQRYTQAQLSAMTPAQLQAAAAARLEHYRDCGD